MKKIFSALCFALFGVTAIMTSCSDVPAPYDIFGDGGDKGDGGEITEDNPFGLDLSNPVADFKADFEEQPDFTQDGEYSSNLNYDYTLEGWKNIASVGDRTWTGVVYKDNTKYIQASANKGNAEKYEAWFISPAFKVDEIKDKAVSFDCSGAYFNAQNSLKVYFLTLENGKMIQTEVSVTGIPTSGSNYVWTKGLTADLSTFAGKTGCIGFCYNSYSANSTTYQLDNIKPGKGEGGSEGGENPPIENLIFKETLGTPVNAQTNLSAFSGWDNPNYTYEISYDKNAIRSIEHKTENNKTETNKVNSIWFSGGYDSWFSIEGINTSGYSKFTVTYEVAANIYNVGETIDLNAIKVSLNDVEVQAPSKIITANTAKNDANIFYTMSVDIEVAGNENSTLKFSVSASDNTVGMRLTNITLQGAEKSETVEPTPEPTPGANDGTEAKPYTVAEAIALNNPGTTAFVKGYIVGAANNAMSKLQTSSFSVASNMVIADTPDETDPTKMIPVELPKNSNERTTWNLKDHPENYQKQVIIEGKLIAYFLQPGLKSPTSITEVQ